MTITFLFSPFFFHVPYPYKYPFSMTTTFLFFPFFFSCSRSSFLSPTFLLVLILSSLLKSLSFDYPWVVYPSFTSQFCFLVAISIRHHPLSLLLSFRDHPSCLLPFYSSSHFRYYSDHSFLTILSVRLNPWGYPFFTSQSCFLASISLCHRPSSL